METWVLILLWVITGVMAAMSIILLTGRGSGFIAGYNTVSNKVKDKYDERKLTKVMGIGLLPITLALAFSLLFEFQLTNSIIEYVVIGVIILSPGLMLIAGNTICIK